MRPFLGIILISAWLLAPLVRGPEDFNFFIFFSLVLLFLLLSLWALSQILGGPSFHPRSPWFPNLLGAPQGFYEWLNKRIPELAWWITLRWHLVQLLSPLSWPRKTISFFLFFLSLSPPLFLCWEFFFWEKIHLFYFSLLLLWIPIFFQLCSSHLDNFAREIMIIQQKDFTITLVEGKYHLSFHREDEFLLSKAANWRVFFYFRSQYSHFQKFNLSLAPYLLGLRSFLYFLAWTQILISHPHFSLWYSGLCP